jgi:predicted outer membrane repeat protein
MFESIWITRLLRSRGLRRVERPRASRSLFGPRRLSVELLEDRLAPATLMVNSTADTANFSDPYLSLREAIALVNSPSLPNDLSDQILRQISGNLHEDGSDSIVFDAATVTGPITLLSGQLELSVPASTATVTIDGGAGVTVDGNNASRILMVDSGAQVSLEHLTLTHGRLPVPISGAAIFNSGTLSVSDSTISSNSAGFEAGGIQNNTGTLTVTDSAISGNTGDGIFSGGTATVTNSTLSGNSWYGIYDLTAALTVTASTISRNHSSGIFSYLGTLTVADSVISNNSIDLTGGGIHAYGGTVTVTDTLISSNTAASTGGGIYTELATLTVTNSTFSGNTAVAGGGIQEMSGAATVTNCTFSGNTIGSSGGGITNISGTLTVTNSIFSGNSATSHQFGNGGGIFNRATATVTDSTLSGNSAFLDGGGIDNTGTLTVTNSILTGNSSTAGSGGGGGGIYNTGSILRVSNSTLSDNTAFFGGAGIYNTGFGGLTVTDTTLDSNHTAWGGGIYNNQGALTVTGSTLSGNSASNFGGGIYAGTGTAIVSGSTLESNSAGTLGGGIENEAGTLTVSNTTFTSNSTHNGGGLYNTRGSATVTGSTFRGNFVVLYGGGLFNAQGPLSVSNSTIDGNSAANSGGGIFNAATPFAVLGTLTVSNSTLVSNSASLMGGGIDNDGAFLMVTDSTLSGNSAIQGGGLLNHGTATLTSSTLAGNSAMVFGGGIANVTFSGGLLSLRNTIVASNASSLPDAGPDISGVVDSASSYNLVGIQDDSLSGISNGVNHNLTGGTFTPLRARMSPLGDYGGDTQSFSLMPTSPALNAGDPALADTPDQRGVVRSGGVNIGAFQASATSFVTTGLPDTSTAGVAIPLTVMATDPFGQTAVGYRGTLVFTSSDGRANLPSPYTFTAADAGRHTFSPGVTFITAGRQSLEASDNADPGVSWTGYLIVQPGALTAFELTAPAIVMAGDVFTLTVMARDAWGNLVSGYSGTVDFSSSDPGASLPDSYTFTAADTGQHSFQMSLATPGSQDVTVADAVLGRSEVVSLQVL